MSHWNKPATWKRNRVAELIGRDGPLCWLCNRPVLIPPKKPGKRASIEHLKARCEGGDDSLYNLVLCHDACNRHLGVHPPEKKLAIRAKWHKEAARSAA